MTQQKIEIDEEDETRLPEYKLFRAGKTAFERYKSLDLSDFTRSQRNVLTALMKMAFYDGIDLGIDSPEKASEYRSIEDEDEFAPDETFLVYDFSQDSL